MKEIYVNLLQATHMFHRLNIGSILPGITQSEFAVLMVIERSRDDCESSGHGMWVSRLVEETRALPPAVSRTLKNLEERGYVVRSVSEKNRRRAYVELTESGRGVLQESKKILNTFAENAFSQTDEEELKRVCAYLHQLYGAASREIEKLKCRQKDRYGKGDVKDGQNI